MRALRPDLQILDLRGNVNTRLAKLDEGQFDAIVLAAAGLLRLGMEARISTLLPEEQLLPAVGQGAIGIEIRSDDAALRALLSPLHDEDAAVCVRAERALNHRLQGGCQVPIAGFAELDPLRATLRLRALVGRIDGREIVRGEISGARGEAESLGATLADELLGRGAARILGELSQAH